MSEITTHPEYTIDTRPIEENTSIKFDEYRGTYTLSLSDHENWNKNWAIAYDRFICLKDGSYEITIQLLIMNSSQGMTSIYKNGQNSYAEGTVWSHSWGG